jgi:DNA-binding XRE family transcriptional regulator
MAKAKAPARKGGRKKNEWTLVTLDELIAYITKSGLTQNAFAQSLGVTNSTFHNWKNGRCAPDESIQGKIRALIDGKKENEVPDKQTKTEKRGRGTKSSTLAALGGGKPAKAAKKAAKKTKKKVSKKAKKAKKTAKKVSKKTKATVQKTVKKAKAVTNGNGVHVDLASWNELEALGQFVKANPGKSSGEIASLLGTVSRVAAIFA